jgi:LmbE family N-acetylglucosaminyl deacetylase
MADDLVMVFSPHPDDDVIACGGTIRARARAGARVVIVYSTDGSMSHAAVPGIGRAPSPRELTTIRQAEAAAALSCVRELGLTPVDITASLDHKRAALAGHRTQVTEYSPMQRRPVVPREFQARVLSRTVEEFWT